MPTSTVHTLPLRVTGGRCQCRRDGLIDHKSQESDLQLLDSLLIAWLHGRQAEVLVDFQALLAGMAGDQMNLGIRQALSRQPRQHLVTEQVRVDGGSAGWSNDPPSFCGNTARAGSCIFQATSAAKRRLTALSQENLSPNCFLSDSAKPAHCRCESPAQSR